MPTTLVSWRWLGNHPSAAVSEDVGKYVELQLSGSRYSLMEAFKHARFVSDVFPKPVSTSIVSTSSPRHLRSGRQLLTLSRWEQTPVPQSLKQAFYSPYRNQWMQSIEAELHALQDKGVYGPVANQSLPPQANILHSKFVFKIKTDPMGNLEKFKTGTQRHTRQPTTSIP